MEINITELFNSICPSDFSASIAEIGYNAGRDTWLASKEEAEDTQPINTQEQQDAFISHMSNIGYSEADEMQSWSSIELNALFIQLVSGDMREFLAGFSIDAENWDWIQYELEVIQGNCCGNMFQGVDNEIYYYLGI